MPSPTCVGASDISQTIEIDSMVSFSAAQEAARLLLEAPHRYTCLAGGTRSGKTFLIVRAIVQRAILSPGSRHVLLRFRANAARATLARETLPIGADLCFPEAGLKEYRTESRFTLKNGSSLTIGGLDDKERVERILGHEYSSVFLNEASQIPYASALVAFTRLAEVAPGIVQRAYVDLNPTSKTHWTNILFGDKRDPVSMRPLSDPDAYARAFLNPRDNATNLDPAFLESLAALPDRHRKRFYEGVYIDAFEDALWTYEIIERNRREAGMIPRDSRKAVVVGLDPSGARGEDHVEADESGIVIVALGKDGDAYILADWSCRENAEGWSRRAVEAYHAFEADCIVAETNFGGDMVRATLAAAGPNVPVRLVTASRGKAVRAEPISVRYALGQVHHVGRFPKLEEQLCAFSGSGYRGQGSPDHADAAIWALTHLFEQEPSAGIIDYYRVLADSLQ